MSQYNSLRATIDANIKTNGNEEITGAILNSVLNEMVTLLGAGFQFMGTATPTNPGSAQAPDYKCFYLATTPGTYTYLGGLVVNAGEVALLKYDASWSKGLTGVASKADVDDIRSAITEFNALTPVADVPGKFINANGSEGTNANTGYFKFAAVGGERLAFSGNFHSTGYNIYYLVAFDAQDNCLGAVGSFRANDGVDYNREFFIAPTGAAYITLNYRTSYKSSFALYSTSAIRSEDCLRSIGVLPVGSLNDVKKTGIWLLTGGNYTDLPSTSKYGFLRVAKVGTYVLQEFISQTGGIIYKRRFQTSGANMEQWQVVGRDATMRGALPSCDLNDVTETGTWILVDSNSYTNAPGGAATGFLRVSNIGINNWILQEFLGFSNANFYKRKFRAGLTIEGWTQISGGGTIINNYNTYEVTATPTITTDTNQYLAASGDTTDRTLDILTMLQTTGVCRLAPGTFYVSGIEMPDDTMILGAGAATKIRLIDGDDRFAIKMGRRCSVRDVSFVGGSSVPTFGGTSGTRHAIVWIGDYSQSESSGSQPRLGLISGCRFDSFSGSAILCHNTGVGTYNNLEVSDCFIKSCWAGINIDYYSEYHKFTNIRTWSCYYGAINNGGNNVFVNCDFSACTNGFLIDNSQGQSPNNSHGSCVGCLFNHTDGNAGVGIRILGAKHGFLFTGCQIFYSKTIMEDSDGIVFSACNYGHSNCNIAISGGGAVLYIGNMFKAAPTITITDNPNVHFENNYVSGTGAVVSN